MRGILNSGGKVKDQENPLVHLLGSDFQSVLLSLESVIAEATASCFFLANPNQTTLIVAKYRLPKKYNRSGIC